jgi:hypothetical protein
MPIYLVKETKLNKNKFYSCEVCMGSYPLLNSLPTTPACCQMRKWFENADYIVPRIASLLEEFNLYHFPATKPMLPKLLTLLQYCHDFGQKSNKWFFFLQEIIQYHFKAEGTCICFDGSREILRGEEDHFEKEMTELFDKLIMC